MSGSNSCFFRTLSCQAENVDVLNDYTNDVVESYVAFIEGRYIDAAETLTNIIGQEENRSTEKTPILSHLYYIRSECELRVGQFKSAYNDGLKSSQIDKGAENTLLERSISMVSIGLKDNDDIEITIEGKKWNIVASKSAQNTLNPIRRIVDRCVLLPNADKTIISLSIGDPTCFGNMLPPSEAKQAVTNALSKPTCHGYVPSYGTEEARAAIAKLWSRDDYVLDAKDIILTNGCSHALEMCINCVANANDNILVPEPGFSLYVTLCQSLGIEPRYYKLKSNRNWEIDLDDMEAAIDDKTKAVIVNNPSNPCGSVYNAEHLQDIINLCEKYCLPILADEIYADMVFPGNKFHFIGPMSKGVPILSCGGLAKRYICPGWRVGWIAIYDRNNNFKESIRPGLLDLSSRILGPNSIIQAALPEILSNTPQTYFDEIIAQIQTNATICCQLLSMAPGLKPMMPQGTMYMLVEVDSNVFGDVENDVVFFTRLFNEQSISCLPASVFGVPNFFRLILTAPIDKTREACERIIEFCFQHKKGSSKPIVRKMRSVKRMVSFDGLPETNSIPLRNIQSDKKY